MTVATREPTRSRTKSRAAAITDAATVVEHIARWLIAHVDDPSLRTRLTSKTLTASEVFDAAQRVMLGVLVAEESQRRGLGVASKANGVTIAQSPLLDGCVIDDAAIRDMVRRLMPDRSIEGSCLWIGAMHERLLGLRATLDMHATDMSMRFTLAASRDSRRRSSGSFYTPELLVQHLLNAALKPAIDEATSGLDGDVAAAAILRLRVCDPACGTGHFLVAAARMLAEHLAIRRRKPVAFAMREVIERCIFGVDLDPLAIEVCRAILWLEAADATFDPRVLHARIKCGHALLGAESRPMNAIDPADERSRADAWCAKVLKSDSSALREQLFHWHVEFPQVFADQRGGFDVVIGNPPFLNQLETGTANDRNHAALLRARFNGVVRGYADVAWSFLLLATEIAKPGDAGSTGEQSLRRAGGRIALVQPQSLLAARDAGGIRGAVLERASLQSLWIAHEHIFDAHVFTCAPSLQRGASMRTRVTRFVGSQFNPLPSVDIDATWLWQANSWASIVADASGIPPCTICELKTVGDLATATADFRDQYYGLEGCLIEDSELSAAQRADFDAFPPLITTGLIDLAMNHWDTRPTRVLKRAWRSPRIHRARLERDPALAAWLAARRVPKILLATQTRIMELIVDERGEFVPSVPLITIVVHDPSRLWHVAAALASPVCTAIALRRFGGTAMTADAIKLSARQVMSLPLPGTCESWDQAAAALRAVSAGDLHATTRQTLLMQLADWMMDAFSVLREERENLRNWWSARAGGPANRAEKRR